MKYYCENLHYKLKVSLILQQEHFATFPVFCISILISNLVIITSWLVNSNDGYACLWLGISKDCRWKTKPTTNHVLVQAGIRCKVCRQPLRPRPTSPSGKPALLFVFAGWVFHSLQSRWALLSILCTIILTQGVCAVFE